MEDKGFIMIDGSHLFSSIYTIWRERPVFNKKKLNIGVFNEALASKWEDNIGQVIRTIYYFKQNDKRQKEMLIIPDSSVPGRKNHWHIKECGVSIKSIPEEELQELPQKYRDHFQRAEKGLDVKLAYDTLLFLSQGVARNFVFLLNDRDYIPLFEAIHSLGGNVYLTALDSTLNIQKGLANLADRCLTLDSELKAIFGITA
jgi:uncharacterized LabA/DUF88 family protein